jgi:hypothetical protein
MLVIDPHRNKTVHRITVPLLTNPNPGPCFPPLAAILTGPRTATPTT